MAANTFPNSKMDLIANIVQRELEFQAKLLPTITDVSQWAQPGARSIAFPKLTSFAVNNRAFGAADTEQTLTDTTDVIQLDKNRIVSWVVDMKDDLQASFDSQAELAKRAAAAHGRDMDNEILAVLEADGVATATVGAITRDIILEMQTSLFDREAIEDDIVLVVGNDSHEELLKISEFTEHQIYGPNNAIRGGQIGTVYGMPVIRRSGIAANTYYMYERGGVALGMQAAPSMDSEKDIQYGTGAMRFAMDVLYGVDSLQRGEKGVGATESALIVKDGN